MVWDDKNVSKLQNYNTVFVQKVLDGSNITDLRKKIICIDTGNAVLRLRWLNEASKSHFLIDGVSISQHR